MNATGNGFKGLFIFLGLLTLLAGCAPTRQNFGGTDSLDQLQNIKSPYAQKRCYHCHGRQGPALGQIRLTALKDTALSLGARAGLAYRSKIIDAILEEQATQLNATYNFYGMMLPHNVLPPVLVEAQNTLNLAGPHTIRLSQKVYKIVAQAHFVTAPPTWRQYLWMDYPQPDIPNHTLLPKNAMEQHVWNHYVAIGWHNGIDQAKNIFAANIARLNRDYKGMSLYRQLYAQNMVSAPFVVKTNLGITGNGNQVHVNDQVLRITALPQLNTNGNTWRPVLVPDPLAKHKQHLLAMLHPKLAKGQGDHDALLINQGVPPKDYVWPTASKHP